MIAVDIGGSHISSIEVADILAGESRGTLQNTFVPVHDMKGEEVIKEWSVHLGRTIKSCQKFDGRIAIAFPGPFDYDNGIVGIHPTGKFGSLQNVNLANMFLEKLESSKQIHFENDAASFGIGEFYYGLGRESSRLLALTIGTGIGSAFVDGGKAMRIGKGVPMRGEVYHLPFKDHIADNYFSTQWFVKKSTEFGLTVSGVKELVSNGNPKIVEKIFDAFVENFIAFFSHLVEDFSPQNIVIGGSISKVWHLFGPPIASYFESKGVQVKPSHLGEKAICLGAARSMYNSQSL